MSLLINDFLAWLPNLIVAVIIVLAAPVLGRIVRRAIEASGGGIGLSNTGLLGRVAEFTVIAFGVILALYQVGIASELVNILFIGVVLAMALAFGLAFGLGGRSRRRRDVARLVPRVDGGRVEDRRGRRRMRRRPRRLRRVRRRPPPADPTV